MAISVPDTPMTLLREWLEDDRRAGMPWTPEDFVQRAHLACRVTPGGRSWLEAIVETHDAWRDAYLRKPAGALEQFAPRSMAEATEAY